MDNIQLILYIVFVIGYLIFKAVTGGKKKEPKNTEPPLDQSVDSRKPEHKASRKEKPGKTTFEDILRELSGADPFPETIDKPRREAKEKADEIAEKATEKYQKATKEGQRVKKITEKIDIGEPASKISLEEFAEEAAPTSNYQDLLRDADDAKKAFILSEIINRKYF